MRIVEQISKGDYLLQHCFMSENEIILIKGLTDISTSIVDLRVGYMLDNQQFKEHTQEVADFIGSIIDEICDMVLAYFSDPTDYFEDERRVLVEKHLLSVKAMAAGIKVSRQEVDDFIDDDDIIPLVMQKYKTVEETQMEPQIDHFTIKEFVHQLCELGTTTSSREIADFLTRKGQPVSPGTIASIKAHFTRKHKKSIQCKNGGVQND